MTETYHERVDSTAAQENEVIGTGSVSVSAGSNQNQLIEDLLAENTKLRDRVAELERELRTALS